MKTIKKYHTTLLLLFSFMLTSNFSFAQAPPELYLVVEYMKSAPGKTAEYEKVEQEQWKLLHQARQKAGHIAGWNMVKVLYPSGANVEYDYYVVTGFNSFKSLAAPFAGVEKVAEATFSKAQIEAMMATSELRTLVNREVYKLQTGTNGGSGAKPAKYAVVNFMKIPTGGFDNWQKIENEYWKPLQQLRVDAGKMAGWALYSLEMPTGANAEYDAVTVDFYHNFEDMNVTTEDLMPFFTKAHPSGNAEKMMNETGASRTMVKSVIIEFISATE